ncbi:MAG: hypothetical protein AB1632_00645 [Nitrospirota bacterium]
MKLKPLHDWAVIKRSEPGEKTAGGIIIPDAAKDKPSEGVVLAIGPGRYMIEKGKGKEKKKKFVPTSLKPGQRVMFQRYMAKEIELDGELITLAREEDILGVFEDHDVAVKESYAVEEKHATPVPLKKKEAEEIKTDRVKTMKKEKPVLSKKRTAKKKETITGGRSVSKTSKSGSKMKAGAAKTKKTESGSKTSLRKEKRASKNVNKTQSVKKKTSVSAPKKAIPGKSVTGSGKKKGSIRATAKKARK